MPESKTADDINIHFATLNRTRWKGAAIDIRTMEATGSQILQMEKAIKAITYLGFLISCFIILIGVVNTYNLSVRERTREIGTMRAMGMKTYQVSLLFLFEASMLAFISSIMGIILACILIILLSIPQFDAGIYSFFFKKGHLHFLLNHFLSLDLPS